MSLDLEARSQQLTFLATHRRTLALNLERSAGPREVAVVADVEEDNDE